MIYERPQLLRVQDALTDCLASISEASGYKHDLADSVFRGRNLFGSDDPLPMVSILEPPVPPELLSGPANATDAEGPWDLLLQGFVDDDLANPTDPAHFLLADVRAALAKEKRRAGKILVRGNDQFGLLSNGVSIVTGMRIGRGVVRPPDADISAKAFFWLSITLTVSESVDDPYA